MKSTAYILILLLSCGLFGFSSSPNTIECFINFNKASKLTMVAPQRLPENAEKSRLVSTENGEVEVSRIDGYRVLYNNRKKAPFINLKVEVSEAGSYASDTATVLNNLWYLNSRGKNMETKDLIEITYNGYRIYGLSRNGIEEGSILGSFVMFPGENVTVYFDFNNLKPEVRNFKSLEEYKAQRNQFFGAYTNHLKACRDK